MKEKKSVKSLLRRCFCWFREKARAVKRKQGRLLARVALIGVWALLFLVPLFYGLPLLEEPSYSPQMVLGLTEDVADFLREEVRFLLANELERRDKDKAQAVVVSPPTEEIPLPKQARSVASEPLSIRFDRILWPLKGEVVSSFGWSRNPVHREWRWSGGIHIVSEAFEMVRTVLPGRVEQVITGPDGLEVRIDHGSGWQSTYRSIADLRVHVSDFLDQNTPFATSGANGQVFYALRYNGEEVDPLLFMNGMEMDR